VQLGAILGPDGLFIKSEKHIFSDLNVKLGAPDDSDDLLDEWLEELKQRNIRMRESRE